MARSGSLWSCSPKHTATMGRIRVSSLSGKPILHFVGILLSLFLGNLALAIATNDTDSLLEWMDPTLLPAKSVIKLGYITGSQMLCEPDCTFYGRPGVRISGALPYALDQINQDPNILPNHTLDFLLAETYGEESRSIRVTGLLLNEGIAAYIGPQETCTHEGRIAAAFNVPMISYAFTATADVLLTTRQGRRQTHGIHNYNRRCTVQVKT